MTHVPSSNRRHLDARLRRQLDAQRLAIARRILNHTATISDADLNAAVHASFMIGLTQSWLRQRQLIDERATVSDRMRGLYPTPWLEQLNQVGLSLSELLALEGFDRRCTVQFPIEFLGQLYEHSLAHPLTCTASNQVAIARQRSIPKAGGIYYTPTAIADYLVSQVLGSFFSQPHPQDVMPHPLPTILDPACGGGMVLLRAYYALEDYLLKQYCLRPDRLTEEPKALIRQDATGQWQLAIAEKQRILSHLYGIDHDCQAIEVTRLSLRLHYLASEPTWPNELPHLHSTILSGNALVETEEEDSLPPFTPSPEFTQVVNRGGFDGVIGNPPYIDSEEMSRRWPQLRAYCSQHYQTAVGNWDLFCVFIERALRWCHPGGIHSFIVPNKLVAAEYAAPTRSLLASYRLTSIRNYTEVPVFGAAVYPIVYTVQKQAADLHTPIRCETMRDLERIGRCTTISYQDLGVDPARPWLLGDSQLSQLMTRLKQHCPPLTEVSEVWGAATVAEAYQLKPLVAENPTPTPDDFKLINSGTIDRYRLLWGDRRFRYLGTVYQHPTLPYSAQNQVAPRRLQQAAQPKLVVAGLSKRLECCFDDRGTIFPTKSTTVILPSINPYYLLGILNSRLIHGFMVSYFGQNRLQGGYMRIGPPQIRQLPIPPQPNETSALGHTLIALVHQRLQAGAIAPTPTPSPNSIPDLEQQIDHTVYALYGLSDNDRSLLDAL